MSTSPASERVRPSSRPALVRPLLVAASRFFIWMGRRSAKQLAGGIMGIGGSKAKVYDEDRPTTRFSDIAGYEGAKREVAEVVDFLSHPERYARAGAIGPGAC